MQKLCGHCHWWRRDPDGWDVEIRRSTPTAMGRCHYDPQSLSKHENDFCRQWTEKEAT